MRFFQEEQKFDQWWIHAITGLTFAGWLYLFFIQIKEKTPVNLIPFIVMGMFVILLIIFFYTVKLTTQIGPNGVKARFSSDFFSKEFKWDEIKQIFIRKYSPVAEYGGWGIRGFGRAKAYNVSGNYGIQIVTRDNKKFLIGTKEPEKVKRVLQYYRDANKIK